MARRQEKEKKQKPIRYFGYSLLFFGYLSALFRSGDALQHELLLWFHAFRGYGVLSEKAAVCDKSWNHSDDHRLENPVPGSG